jgi:hypothetical protein
MSKGTKSISMEVLSTTALVTTGSLELTKVSFFLFVVEKPTTPQIIHTVDLEVIKLCSQVPSETTETRESF